MVTPLSDGDIEAAVHSRRRGRRPASVRPEVVVHHLEQAKAALRIVEELGVSIRLRSAPGAAASAGVGYLQALGEAAGQEMVIDCDDDAGLVMAALRAGCRTLIYAGPDHDRSRLRQMAGRYGADIRGPGEGPPPLLALSPDDDEAAVRALLESRLRDR